MRANTVSSPLPRCHLRLVPPPPPRPVLVDWEAEGWFSEKSSRTEDLPPSY